MSATEIIKVIKAINDHVTNKYSDAICCYLTEKTNTRVSSQLQFFNIMDKAVQKLINDIIGSIKPTSSAQISTTSSHLTEIQKHCSKYNEVKKDLYDQYLSKIREFDKSNIAVIKQMMKEKLIGQNNLFETALQNQVTQQNQATQQNTTQDIINLLTLCQNGQNAQSIESNQSIENQLLQAPIDQTLNFLNALSKSQTSAKPSQTSYTPNSGTNVNQISEFLSLISQANGNGNASKATHTTSNNSNTAGAKSLQKVQSDTNGQSPQNTDANNSLWLPQNILQNINMSQNSNTHHKNGSNIPALPKLNVNDPSSGQKHGKNRSSLVSFPIPPKTNDANKKHNSLPPSSFGNKAPKLTIPANPAKAVSIPCKILPLNLPTDILDSFPEINIKKPIGFPLNASNANTGAQLLANGNGNGASNMNIPLHLELNPSIYLTPTAPPKPPPPIPAVVHGNVNAPISDGSSVSSDSNSKYECRSCNKDFETQKQWKSHLKKHHFKAHPKKKKYKKKVSKSKRSKHKKKTKGNRKRELNKIVHGSTENERKRQKISCEYCDKEFCGLIAYAKHYNHHMTSNKKNVCNFCYTKFKNDSDLKKHIGRFGGGMCTEDGQYQCCKCAMKFANKVNVESHINYVHMGMRSQT